MKLNNMLYRALAGSKAIFFQSVKQPLAVPTLLVLIARSIHKKESKWSYV